MILESVIRKACNAAFRVGYLSLLNAKGRVAHMLLTLARARDRYGNPRRDSAAEKDYP
jgi:hypothetical protein